MLTLGQRKFGTLTLAVLGVLVAATAVISVAVPELMPWSFVALAAAAVFLYFTSLDVTLWAWVWVLSFGLLDRPLVFIQIPGFINLTIPRILYVVAVAAFGLYLITRKRHIRGLWKWDWIILGFLAYVAINTSVHGWTARIPTLRTAPYYRFFEGLLLPFVMYLMLAACVRDEKNIRRALLLLTAYGWYALYIGYLQRIALTVDSGARALIWPSYINQPSWGRGFGIHFERARGAYTMSNPQAILLSQLFYVCLYLIRRIRGPYRAALIVQAFLIPPAIFFTGLRAGYLAFLLSGIVWLFWGCERRLAGVKAALAALIVMLGVVALWPRLTSTDRTAGGVAQVRETIARVALIEQAFQMAGERPLTGVGFGHFADHQMGLQRDPASISAGALEGVMMQHNLFLAMLAETGIVGLVGIIAVFWMLYRMSVRLYRRMPATATGWLSRDFVVLFWIALVNYLTNAMFVDPLWDIPTNGLFWCFAGLTAGYHHLLQPQSIDLAPAAAAIGPGR
ncbi:MAG TPA: O-antigen ligase family protein [Phycisphaerae bacterium]|nr:O-antigen ligase family protein [Phycisphaerae bacterium]